jgi:PAS domain S-box-containing protein
VRSIIKKAVEIITHVQVLVVFLAFALMVFLSYRFMSGIERKHLLRDVNSAFSVTQAQISAELREPETLLGNVAETIRSLILRGDKADRIQDYIIYLNNYAQDNDQKRLMGVIGFYGIFDVFDGKFLSGDGEWPLPEDYIPQSRPWYIAAVEADGDIGVTKPYIDIKTDKVAITFSRRIFDDEGNPLGITCLDMTLDKISGYAVNTVVVQDSYGILFDNDFYVLAHPLPLYLGKPLGNMNDGPAIVNELLAGRNISERKATDYNGDTCVLFLNRLDNGWYLAVVAYEKSYYKSVTLIAHILIALGIGLAAVLSAILLNIVRAKNRADQRTQIMLDATPLGITLWDINGDIVDCNMEAVRLTGVRSKREYFEKLAALAPEYQSDGQKTADKLIKTIKAALTEGRCHIEWEHKTTDGELILYDIMAVSLKYKERDIVVTYARDIREIRSKEAKLKEVNERIQIMFNSSPLACCYVNKDIKVIDCNQKMVELFGLRNKQEFIDRFMDLSPENQPNGVKSHQMMNDYILKTLDSGYCHFEYMCRTLDGEELPVETTLVCVRQDHEQAVVLYTRDLRELKALMRQMRKAELAEESNRAKTNFLARMSHEIRTPMNVILGITDIQLQDETLPSTIKEAFSRIYNSGDLLLGIINDILDLSKIEANRLELSPVDYEIASLIHDTVQLNIMRYESKSVGFKLSVNENLPLRLNGDELRIKQILNNLLSNAFKYTHEGMVNVTVTFDPEKSDNENIILIFIVNDTGQGMTAEQVAKLGSEYSRFNAESNRTTEGTGLGMNIACNLIRLMNGNLEVDSVPGLGSTFTVKLPQGVADPAPLGKEYALSLSQLNLDSKTVIKKTHLTRDFMPYGRVLVVDDVESNLYVARGLLAPYGLSIDTALSGFEAVEKIKEGSSYDIIFMDHMMPKMDGIEASKIIRGFGYNKPIVALTANALTGQADVFLNNGFDAFISKPIDVRQLNVVLNKMIRDKQPVDVIQDARQQKNTINTAAESKQSAIDRQLAEFFVRDARKAINVIEAICLNKCRRKDDIPLFIINVHAMKSALANIGENELSAFAQKLEQDGREHNVKMILQSIPEFLDKLHVVIEKHKPAEMEGRAIDENDSEVREFLNEKLLKLENACVSFDKKAAKEILAQLKEMNWPDSIREKLGDISGHLLHSEFEETVNIIKLLLDT